MNRSSYHRYWGKARPGLESRQRFHLLAYHCLDVAAVMRRLCDTAWGRRLPAPIREALVPSLPFFAAMHDLGKFSRGFQNLVRDLDADLVPYMPRFRYGNGIRHDSLGLLAWRAVRTGLSPWLDKPNDKIWERLICSVVGHHGQPPRKADGSLGLSHHNYFDPTDLVATQEFACAAAQLLLTPEGTTLSSDALHAGATSASWRVAGLGVLADWIGSNQDHFRYVSEPMPVERYWHEYACPRADAAIAATGLAETRVRAFVTPNQLFDHLRELTPLQRLVAEIKIGQGPQLFVLEDVTGAGKTEAALILAHRLMAAHPGAGLYFGLPTMATANQMFRRVGPVQTRLFEATPRPNLVLAHGSRHLLDDFRVLPTSPADRAYAPGEESASGNCSAWLGDSNKKALLADLGVGTIDQALLAVMPAQHQSLRLLGMAGKVLVIDEIHSFDGYTSELLCALLRAHAGQGGSAVLLSATLPGELRESLVNAFRQGAQLDRIELPPDDRYPLLTHQCKDAQPECMEIASRAEVSRRVPVTFLHDEGEVMTRICEAALAGNSVAWIRNTVDDARESWEALRSLPELDPERITLFHSRYALSDRLDIETRVLDMLGKASRHEQRRGQIVVGSPVLEVGLDYCVDVLIVDMAPIDALMQRAGRLHRHVRDALCNPAATEGRPPPVLHVFAPEWSDDPPAQWYRSRFRRAATIYPDTGRLWLSQRILLQTGAIALPLQARLLIESVYGPDAEAHIPKALLPSREKQEGNLYAERTLARRNCLELDQGYTWEAGEWDQELNTPTRLAEEGREVVLLLREGHTLRPWAADHPHPWDASTVKVPSRLFAAATPAWEVADAAALDDLRTRHRALKYATLLVMVPSQAPGVWRAEGIDNRQRPVVALYDPVAGWRTGSQG
ncbi:MAG: CRISPR-associated helicase Cas3' [Rubrivivax sp.]|nr:CRISPR-associated helicase Cas3' [Rubrivivax sp.]